MSLCYSKLYYASDVWLLPTLKENLFKKLYSQSGKCLKVIDGTLSYRELHIQFRRAPPKIFASYQTAIYYYDLVNGYLIDQEERTAIQQNTVTDRRNKCLVFLRNNNYKPG